MRNELKHSKINLFNHTFARSTHEDRVGTVRVKFVTGLELLRGFAGRARVRFAQQRELGEETPIRRPNEKNLYK